MKIAGLLILTALAAGAADVSQIMARVGANQQSARATRQFYVYRQEQLLRMHRGNGKLAREEQAEYVVTPLKQNFEKHLTKFAGKYELKGQYVPYDQPDFHYRGVDLDADLMQSMAEDLMNDKKSRDGIGQDLFPLATGEQGKYDFRLVGTEIYHGRSAYRVAFQPKPHLEDGASWKGEALIDAAEYQPILVVTSLAEKVPLLVKTLLGTDIKGLGFSLTYRKFADGVWFPVSYGGEFAVRGLFFYKRKISVSMQNSDFRKTDVSSTVAYVTDAH